MSVWPHFTKESPCPACNHYDWNCRAGDLKFICMRVQSDHPAKDGGWYHDYGETYQRPAIHWSPPPKPIRDIRSLGILITGNSFDLANKLGVSPESLIALECGWANNLNCYLFPMRDGNNNVIGYNRRYNDGEKKIVFGTCAGLYIPQSIEIPETLYVVEGASDTAAMLTLGLYAIGRFNCSSGADLIKVFCKVNYVRRLVIVADNDEIKADGRKPGLDGAKKLKKELKLRSVIWQPPSPCKDVREFLKRGGTAKMIEDDVNQKVWKIGL